MERGGGEWWRGEGGRLRWGGVLVERGGVKRGGEWWREEGKDVKHRGGVPPLVCSVEETRKIPDTLILPAGRFFLAGGAPAKQAKVTSGYCKRDGTFFSKYAEDEFTSRIIEGLLVMCKFSPTLFNLPLVPGISTLKTGEPCPGMCDHFFIPYCKKCRTTTGDPSISVRYHERFGKMLCAERDLPKGYRAALWGDVVKEADMPDDEKDWGFETNDGL